MKKNNSEYQISIKIFGELCNFDKNDIDEMWNLKELKYFLVNYILNNMHLHDQIFKKMIDLLYDFDKNDNEKNVVFKGKLKYFLVKYISNYMHQYVS